MTRALVTGGAGFIGSNIVSALVERGTAVRVFDDLSNGLRSNLDGTGADVELVVGDLRDADAVRQAAAGVDTVFHWAPSGRSNGPSTTR